MAYDLIVLGGGVLGAATAYESARSGVRTLLVDAELDGRATSAGAGIVCPWTSRITDTDFYRFAIAGAERYPSLAAELAELGLSEIGYRVTGALCPLRTQEERDSFWERIGPRLDDGSAHGAVRELSPTEAVGSFPPLRTDTGAVHIEGAARVDGRLLRDALRQAAERHGAETLRASAELTETGVRVDGRSIDAERVVVCAGTWTARLLEGIGATLPGGQQRGQILHLRLPDAPTASWPVLLPEGGHYMVCFDDSRVVVGATREPGEWLELTATAEGLAELLGFALELTPGLAKAGHIETRIGYRPMSHATLPQFGQVPGRERIFAASGLGASGLTIGPNLGKLIVAEVLGQRPELDLGVLRPW